jgi:CheY-like chemotaxis protein
VEIIRKLVEVNGKQAISAYLADVTEKRDIQNRILEQNKRLKEFAFITSHKIRQPLANILGLIELVKSDSHSGQDVTITLETLRMLTGQLDGVVHEMGQALAELDVDIEKSLFYNDQEEKRIQNVWIVDDDQVITYITTRLMKNADPTIKISEFTSAKMALEKLRLDPAQPDILLLDINMPGISGWQFLEEMQAMHRFVNVYMYSSSIDPEDVKKARSYPMVRDFLSKPFDMETVRHLLSIPLIRSQVS